MILFLSACNPFYHSLLCCALVCFFIHNSATIQNFFFNYLYSFNILYLFIWFCNFSGWKLGSSVFKWRLKKKESILPSLSFFAVTFSFKYLKCPPHLCLLFSSGLLWKCDGLLNSFLFLTHFFQNLHKCAVCKWHVNKARVGGNVWFHAAEADSSPLVSVQLCWIGGIFILKSVTSDYFFSLSQAGGCAGMCVDLTLFPLDTIKTRLQSQQGFHKAGGFRGIYAGVPSAAVGSFPNGTLRHKSLLTRSPGCGIKCEFDFMVRCGLMQSVSKLCLCLVLAAAFFVTYESMKSVLSSCFSARMAPVTHMLAASLGEIVCYLCSLQICVFSVVPLGGSKFSAGNSAADKM